jgi:WD40 repeat protein
LYDLKRHVSSPVPISAHEINATAIDPTGRRVAFAGVASLGDRVVIQARDGTARVSLPAHGQVAWLAFSRDAKHLLSAAQDGKVRIWNAASGALEHVLQGGEGGMLQAQFGPHGDKVAGADADGTVRIWRLDGSKPLVLYGHVGPVTSVGFNRDGSQVVSGGKDGTVRVWDAHGGQMAVVLGRHGAEVLGVAFSSDGRQVLSGATDGIAVSECEVCGRFADVLALAKTRSRVSLSSAERARLQGG